MSESFNEYIAAVFKHWWWLVGTLVGGVITVFGLLGIPTQTTIWVGLLIMFFCLSVAQFLAYREIRKTNVKLKSDLKDANQYQAKSQRIEIISKEKYPAEILRIFDDMRRCLTLIVESSDNVQGVTVEKLFDVCKQITPHELYLALNQKTIEDNIDMTYLFYRRFNLGIGLSDIQTKDDNWKKLVEKLETTKKDIPDQELINAVFAHYSALNGVHSIKLFYRYMKIYGTNEMILRGVEPFRSIPNLLDQTMTRINKRIVELKLGEEPKWEMLYIREK